MPDTAGAVAAPTLTIQQHHKPGCSPTGTSPFDMKAGWPGGPAWLYWQTQIGWGFEGDIPPLQERGSTLFICTRYDLHLWKHRDPGTCPPGRPVTSRCETRRLEWFSTIPRAGRVHLYADGPRLVTGGLAIGAVTVCWCTHLFHLACGSGFEHLSNREPRAGWTV